ncbi:MAG: hypothetical protein J5858_17100 [Lentisphaeria bacterium]|nr:hypothetical protein [Lentisphaeria bacterium]
MRILIKPRTWVEKRLDTDRIFCQKFNFISIFSSQDFSPLPDQPNILKLEFDDITETDIPQVHADGRPLILFNREHAEKIVRFIQTVNRRKILAVHCDAGISRSGAVGEQLNEYFNRIMEDAPDDYAKFFKDNDDIIPNRRVAKILHEVLEEFFVREKGKQYSDGGTSNVVL